MPLSHSHGVFCIAFPFVFPYLYAEFIISVYSLPKTAIFFTLAALFFLFPAETALTQNRFYENGSPARRGLDVGWMADSPTRKKIDLSGLWNFQIDGGGDGTVRVPSSYDFVGKVAFQRTFDVSAEDLSRYQFHLVMFGANYNTEVRVNTDFVTQHLGGYTSFTCPIPLTALQPGNQNIIRITTDNSLDGSRTVPLRSQVWGWKNYGGILRDVFVVGTPIVYISDIVMTSSVSRDLTVAQVKVTASIGEELQQGKDPRTYAIVAELYDKQTDVLVATSNAVPVARQGKEWGSPTVEMMITGPRLWSPENPDLYYVKVVLLDGTSSTRLDEYHANFGIRRLAITGADVTLNGTRVQLKGMIWYEDRQGYGSSLSYEAMEKDVLMMKAIGANAVRFGHHPPHPSMIDLCDRYGLLAFVELPLKDVPASILAHEHYVETASTTMREMIARDRNHASVVAWGLGDELETQSDVARKFVEPLAKLARSMDARPLYYASRTPNDACSDLIDLTTVALTTRDIKDFKKELEDARAANTTKPFIIIRMGSEVQPNNNNGYSDPLSLQAQARYFLQHFDIVRASSITGAFVWAFNDWRGDRPALTINTGDPWMHTLGIVSSAREKRYAYEAVRYAFNGDKFSAIPAGSSPSSSPIVYVLSGLVLLIGTAYLYNASRRFRDGLNRSVANAYNFFADVRDQRIVTIFHSTILGLIVSAASAVVLSSMLHHFRTSIVLDNFLSYVLLTDDIKEQVVRLIRNPQLFIVVFTAAFFALLLLISTLVWVLAPFFKARIYLFHAYATTMWSTPPLLVLVPVGMILSRLMDSPIYFVPAVVLFAVLVVWVAMRFLKGISIILDVPPVRVYALGVFLLLALGVCAYFYLDRTHAASDYFTFLFNDLAHRDK